MPWNPEQYERFKAERFQPFDDLVNLIDPSGIQSVVDLGCGTGELTQKLCDIFESADVIGLDLSTEMLAKARTREHSQLRFVQGNIGDFNGAYDLVFSHAALQWLPDHAHLIPQIWHTVKPGGQLAIQIPSNHAHMTHKLILEVAAEATFVDSLDGWVRISPVQSIEFYANLLYQLRGEQITVMEKVYPHILRASEELVEWVKGTALLPYLEKLTPDQQTRFLERYAKKLKLHFPETPVFYGFRRLLIYAKKPHVKPV